MHKYAANEVARMYRLLPASLAAEHSQLKSGLRIDVELEWLLLRWDTARLLVTYNDAHELALNESVFPVPIQEGGRQIADAPAANRRGTDNRNADARQIQVQLNLRARTGDGRKEQNGDSRVDKGAIRTSVKGPTVTSPLASTSLSVSRSDVSCSDGGAYNSTQRLTSSLLATFTTLKPTGAEAAPGKYTGPLEPKRS